MNSKVHVLVDQLIALCQSFIDVQDAINAILGKAQTADHLWEKEEDTNSTEEISQTLSSSDEIESFDDQDEVYCPPHNKRGRSV